MTTPYRWFLRCFGALSVQRDGHHVDKFRTQKTAALLALLALKGAQSRETVCALLWPDASPEAARNSLSAALSSLRRELGDELVRADRQCVALNVAAFETDVRAFDAALQAQNWMRAVELYRGHLLPGFHDDPFPALENEYREKARATFAARLGELENNGKCAASLQLARRAAGLFGDDERWFVALMRAHYGLGDFDAALRVYESLSRFARKNGDSAGESARLLAKQIRRDRERDAATPDGRAAVAPVNEAPRHKRRGKQACCSRPQQRWSWRCKCRAHGNAPLWLTAPGRLGTRRGRFCRYRPKLRRSRFPTSPADSIWVIGRRRKYFARAPATLRRFRAIWRSGCICQAG